jgi:hypothetical protein
MFRSELTPAQPGRDAVGPPCKMLEFCHSAVRIATADCRVVAHNTHEAAPYSSTLVGQ